MKTIIVYSLIIPGASDEYVFTNIDELFKMAKELSRPNSTVIIKTFRTSEDRYNEILNNKGDE